MDKETEDKELESEIIHLEQCKEIISQNIEKYEFDLTKTREQINDIYYEIREGRSAQLHDQVSIVQSIQEQIKQELHKNHRAYSAPYFGRIDYEDYDDRREESFYIGKQGILEDNARVAIVDWRAPVASVYYENGKGDCKYFLPEGNEKKINLHLKRSFDIENGELQGFFDSESAVDDELLIKYLSKNKVVLNDIIATIQQEQNQIIRANPFQNIIVQGVAGSGKTSVIIHRIAYILYNFGERFVPTDFCIVGSNARLVEYIAGGLPELDIYNVKLMKMDELFPHFLGKYWKKKYRICSLQNTQEHKSKLAFVKALNAYLSEVKDSWLIMKTVTDKKLGRLLKEENNLQLIRELKNKSYNQLLEILDERLRIKIKSVTGENIDLREQKLSEYKNHYSRKKYKGNLLDIYEHFLQKFGEENELNVQKNIDAIVCGKFDVYDVAALTLIYYRIARLEDIEEVEQLFIDEAQDFGASIFYILNTVLSNCYFNIVGDVSQNINFYSGMNDWGDITTEIFDKETDQLLHLAKSYRNTIEISDFAGKILESVGGEKYKIEPVIRHGEDVKIIDTISWQEGIAVIEDCIMSLKDKGYQTIAIICFADEESNYVKKKLEKRAVKGLEQLGISVLSVYETKGLEFDAVIVWKPDMKRYQQDVQYAKKLYVAVTRALHELYLIK